MLQVFGQHPRFAAAWLAAVALALATVGFVAATSLEQVALRWKPGSDPRDRSILIFGGTTVEYVVEAKSSTDEKDYPRAPFRGRRGWGVPGLFRVTYVPPVKPPAGARGWVFDLRIVTVRLWPLILLLVMPAAVGTVKVWRLSRLGADVERCPACGYDLRATPDRCPECGLAVALKCHGRGGTVGRARSVQ